ncbi:Asp23/Gls24 family envelope stress response protein [Pediococcus parvulus]|uniref:Asp23/Gls24 family envelope stress response protein n=1 Tax=Pediococcus parvulus TaxID=54062 RepID=UPI0021A2A9A3|nr:Asp23/Gls24 family envelope stress response protein [Pediococcus parvulus]MCT3031510.1 Asp23/Gls24 family envelope stress response protein [Pediococcus parvulus]
MAEDKYLALAEHKPTLGEIKIAPEVVSIIAGISVEEVQGVHLSSSGLSESVTSFLTRNTKGQGVKLGLSDGKLRVDVYVYLDYGTSVPEIAKKVQSKVNQQLLLMTELEVTEVNIHVEGIIPAKSTSTVDPDDIFAENDGDEK